LSTWLPIACSTGEWGSGRRYCSVATLSPSTTPRRLALTRSLLCCVFYRHCFFSDSWTASVGSGSYSAAVSVLACWTHFFGLVSLGAMVASSFFTRSLRPHRVHLVSAGLLTILLTAPLVLEGFRGGQGGLSFIRTPGPLAVPRLLHEFSGRSFVLGLLLSTLIGFAVVRFLLERRHSGRWDQAVLTVSTYLALSLGVTLAVSLLLKPVWDPRYLIFCLPPFLILAASAPNSRRWRLPAVLILLTTAASLAVSSKQVVTHTNDDWRGATAYVMQDASTMDGIVFRPAYLRIPFDYYRVRSNRREDSPTPIVPAEPWTSPHFQDLPEVSPGSIDVALQQRQHVWLVTQPAAASKGPQDLGGQAVSRCYRLADQRLFRGVRISKFARMQNFEQCPS